MRPCSATVAVFATSFLALVAAVPSPAAYHSAPSVADRPRWRTLSESLVAAIWTPRRSGDEAQAPIRNVAAGQLSSTTLARYGSDVVLRFNISTAVEAKSLADAADTLLLDVWEFSHDWVDVRLSKDMVAPLLGLLPPSLRQSHTPLLRERELAQAVQDTYPTPRGQRAQPLLSSSSSPEQLLRRPFSPSVHHQPDDTPESNLFFRDYQPLSVIEPWMRLLASLFTTHVRRITIGLSAEGRPIPALRVGVHPAVAAYNKDSHPGSRKTVLVVGGQHAREWISTSTVSYIAYSLITRYGKEASITRLLSRFDFIFIPSLNPDGYVYTWSTDRLWRKNRQATSFRFCPGLDLDRAFSYRWDGNLTGSLASNPCSESFAGSHPEEAVESAALAAWARNETEHNNVELVGFLDLHSYSQQILYPYSYSCADTPPGLENLEEVAIGLEKAIRVAAGRAYQVMPACAGNVARTSSSKSTSKPESPSPRLKSRDLLPRIEAAGGSALDFFYHEMRVRYAYQLKLRDRGTYGFLLPRENIVPVGREILEAVLHLGKFLGEAYEDEDEAESQRDDEESGLGDTIKGVVTAEARHDMAVGDAGDGALVDGQSTVDDRAEAQWDLKRRRRR